MRNDTVAYYVRKLDEAPQIFGDTRLPSLQFCQRYNRDAHYATVKDSNGLARWVTQKQMRIYGIVARISLSETGFATMKDVAREAQCHTTTVSRTTLKLQAWGLYAFDVKRGRGGGIFVRLPWGEHAKFYIRAARQKLRDMANRARRKVASVLLGGQREDQRNGDNVKDNMDATFRRFAERVLMERAYLALEDPEGEAESIAPIDERGALRLLEQAATSATL